MNHFDDPKGVARILTIGEVDVLLAPADPPPTLQELLCATGGCRAAEMGADGRFIDHAPGCAKFKPEQIREARTRLELKETAETLRAKVEAARARAAR